MPLTEKQMSYLALAWQCFESEPKIDYEKFKQVAGLASSNSARELMRVTKKKLKEEYGALSGTITSSNVATVNGTGKASPSKITKSTPTPKRPRAKKAASEVNGSEEDQSPSKKSKTTSGSASAGSTGSKVKTEVVDEDDDGLGMFQ